MNNKAQLGDYLKWNGELAEIVGEVDLPMVIISPLKPKKCAHCGGDLGREQIHVVLDSPLFSQNTEAIPTIKVKKIKL